MEALSKNKIKWIRSLRLKKNREQEKLFIVEGEKMVKELVENWSDSIRCICGLENDLGWAGTFYTTSEKSLKEISSFKTPNKYVAVAEFPSPKVSDSKLILALDGVQDPGNMGTIIRTADWYGIEKIICSIETVDKFNPKVIQSSMGSIFRVSVEYLDLAEYLEKTDLKVYGALLEGENINTQNLDSEGIIVMGNEGSGINNQIKELIDQPLHIPRIGGAESLNVSVATAIFLNEFSVKS